MIDVCLWWCLFLSSLYLTKTKLFCAYGLIFCAGPIHTKNNNVKSTVYTHCCIFTVCDLIFFYWTRNVPLTAFGRICLLSVFWLHPFIKVSNAAACKMVVWKAHSTWSLKSRWNHICMPYYFHNVPYFLVKLLNNNNMQAGVWFYPLGIYSIPFHLKTRLTDVRQQG